MLRAHYLLACQALLGTTLYGLSADTFRSADISEDNRHPLSAVGGNGDFVTVGHFRGTLRQGRTKVCNGFSCYNVPNQVYRSQGWADIFVSYYNASRVLQWTRTGGGTGDDKARVVNVDHDGDILVAGYITGVNAKFNGLEISSRTALSRTIFLAKYGPTGAIKFIKEIASCPISTCDVTALSLDETGAVLTGTYHGQTSFGTIQKCTDGGECLDVAKEYLDYDDPGELKSTGSGQVHTDRCWVTKVSYTGEHFWSKDCNDESFETDLTLDYPAKVNTYEQSVWANKAATFFNLRPTDQTGILGRETNFEDYAKIRRSSGL